MTDVYNTVKTSLLKFCKDLCDDNHFDFQPVDFDAHATFESWPTGDLIGIAEYSITNTQEQYDITVMIGVSSDSTDELMARMLPVVGALFQILQVGYKGIKIVDPTSSPPGDALGNLVVMDQVHALPAARTKTRPIILVAVHLASAFLSPP